MEVVRITPRGYCHGVVDAIKIARKEARETEGPIHMLGYLVHNEHVTDDLKQEGVSLVDAPDRLSGLDLIQEGTVILTAHGVSPAVKERALARGLRVVDATCSDVVRTHDLVKDLVGRGYTVVYIGKRGHPEPEGVIGEAPGRVHLVENPEDVEALRLDPATPLAVTCQTTLSVWDTDELIGLIQDRYPSVEVHNEICRATQERQEAAVAAAADCDVVIVVGSARSSNSRRLVQVVQDRVGRPAHLIDTLADLDLEWLRGAARVGVTSGASTPSQITREVIHFLEALPDDALTPGPARA
ncbi:MAG: 4-hydroxy-3-methylbut-2-enyl diphosphate reductase [Candidatus Dormibacteria bacterium]